MLAVVKDKSPYLSGLRQLKLTCSCRIQNVFFYSEQVSVFSAVIQGLSKCDSALFNTVIFIEMQEEEQGSMPMKVFMDLV